MGNLEICVKGVKHLSPSRLKSSKSPRPPDSEFPPSSKPQVHPDSELPLSSKSHGPSIFGASTFFQTLWSIQTQSSHHFPDSTVHQTLNSDCHLNPTDHPDLEFPIPFKPHRPSRAGVPTVFQTPQSIQTWSSHFLPNPPVHQTQNSH